MAGEKCLIFQLGTNNWQTDEEPAPGSGILHEAHHVTFNLMEGTSSYSVYPSAVTSSNPTREQVKVVKLPHKIPICESVSPTSDKKWHTMTAHEIEIYLERLETICYKQMKEAEEAEGMDVTFIIAHHTFTNPLVMKRVVERRVMEGKAPTPIVSFCHGTAIKMYENELSGMPGYPLKFHPMMEELGVFSDPNTGVQVLIAISEENLESFQKCFPEFPEDRSFVSLNGYDPLVFYPEKKSTLQEVLATFKTVVVPGVAKPGSGAATGKKAKKEEKKEGEKKEGGENKEGEKKDAAPKAKAKAKALPKAMPKAMAAPAAGAGAVPPTGCAPPAQPGQPAAAGAAPAAGATKPAADVPKPTKGPPIDASKFTKMVLFVGKFANWKRLDSVLASAAVWEKTNPEIVTVIAGTGGPKDIKKYHEMAYEEYGLSNTFFVGSQNQTNLRKLCSIADVGVFPSKKEPFGMVFIECMACGTPVIGAASGGPLSFVTPEVGVLVPESSDEEMFAKSVGKAVMQALEEDWKVEKKAACLELVKAFTMQKQCKQIKDKVLAIIQANKNTVSMEERTKVRAYYKHLNTHNHDQIYNYYTALGEERKVVGG